MEKHLKYYILKNKKVIIEILKGSISLEDYIAFKKQQLQDEEYSPEMNYIINYQQVKMDFSDKTQEKMEQYLEFSRSHQNPSFHTKIAVITSTPDQVVYSTLFKQSDTSNVSYEIFSTMETALKWFGLTDDDIQMIESY